MFPVRCYTCDTVVGHHWETYSAGLKDGDTPERLLESLGQRRLCCRRMFLSHVDLIKDQVAYPCVDVRLDEHGTVLHRHVRHVRECACD